MSYRFYRLDANGHITGVEIIDALSDADVAREAERLQERLGDPGYEVWDCGRPVLSNTQGCAPLAPSPNLRSS